jgi:hypothetical protein
MALALVSLAKSIVLVFVIVHGLADASLPGVAVPLSALPAGGLSPAHTPGNIYGPDELTERSPLAVAFFARGFPRPRQVEHRAAFSFCQ